MVSKKDALIVGVALIGGIGVAQAIGGGEGGAGAREGGRYGKIGGIFSGSPTGTAPKAAMGAAPTIYQMPAAADVSFPAAPSFDIGTFLAPSKTMIGTVSGRGKKQPTYEPTGISGVSKVGEKAFLTSGLSLGYTAKTIVSRGGGVSTPSKKSTKTYKAFSGKTRKEHHKERYRTKRTAKKESKE